MGSGTVVQGARRVVPATVPDPMSAPTSMVNIRKLVAGVFHIGIDEAGYGPNLGPLVIGGCLWHSSQPANDLYVPLANSVTNRVGNQKLITVADSKALYQPNRGLATLANNLFPLIFSEEDAWKTPWPGLLERVIETEFPPASHFDDQGSFLRDDDEMVRIDSSAIANAFFIATDSSGQVSDEGRPSDSSSIEVNSVRRLRENFLNNCSEAQVELQQVLAVCLMPADFNKLVTNYGNKSSVLTVASLLLVKRLLTEVNLPSFIRVQCDKHGGRNRYRKFLERVLNPNSLEIIEESSAVSVYRLVTAAVDVEISFTAKGEENLTTALSSMFAKFLRESVMHRWNHYWQGIVENIRPTQGYPVDAARFFAQIEPHLKSRAISKTLVWRER